MVRCADETFSLHGVIKRTQLLRMLKHRIGLFVHDGMSPMPFAKAQIPRTQVHPCLSVHLPLCRFFVKCDVFDCFVNDRQVEALFHLNINSDLPILSSVHICPLSLRTFWPLFFIFYQAETPGVRAHHVCHSVCPSV